MASGANEGLSRLTAPEGGNRSACDPRCQVTTGGGGAEKCRLPYPFAVRATIDTQVLCAVE